MHNNISTESSSKLPLNGKTWPLSFSDEVHQFSTDEKVVASIEIDIPGCRGVFSENCNVTTKKNYNRNKASLKILYCKQTFLVNEAIRNYLVVPCIKVGTQ